MSETVRLSNFASIANAVFNSVSANATAVTSMSVGGHTISATGFPGTANNANNLGGVPAASYQLNSTLAANVATLAANTATFANSSATNTFTVGTAAYFVANGDIYIGSNAAQGTAALQVFGAETKASIGFVRTNLTASGQSIAGIDSRCFDGNTYFAGGTINFRAAENWSNTNHGTDIQFRTTPTGSGGGLTESMRIAANGNVGIGTSSPTEKLDVVDGWATVRFANNNMSRISLTNANRAWSISNYGTQITPNGALTIGDETAGAVRLQINTAGSVMMPAQPALRLDGNNGNGFDFTSTTQLLVSTYYSTTTARGNLSWNSSNGRITAGTGGYYNVSYTIYVQTGGVGNGRLALWRNGGVYQLLQAGLATDGMLTLDTIVQLNVNDYVELITDTFDPIRLYMGPAHTSFSMFLLG